MSLPNDWTPELTIPRNKITDYLLNLDHRRGRHKARQFIARGFDPNYESPFMLALFQHGRPSQLVREFDAEYGRKFVYEGPMECPDGTLLPVRSIWQRYGADPRRFLVSAYPI